MFPDRFPVIPEDVLAVLDRFSDSHAEAFCVGGCVRDALRGVEPNDWDLCTILRPEETLALFSDHTCIPTGMKHGTITVLTKTGRPLEITTYRVDGTYADHRRPDEVTFSRSLSEDCARRDFTVNAMAYHPKTGIVDHYGGQKDLDAHLIRCVGDPDRRFCEDALRMLRAVRFASCLDYDIEKETAFALHRNRALLAFVAKERITVEFSKLLSGVRAAEVLLDFHDLYAVFLPQMDALPRFGEELRAAFALCDDPVIRLAVLMTLCRIDAGALSVLTLDNETKHRLIPLAAGADSPLPENRTAMLRAFCESSPAGIKDRIRLYAALHPENRDEADTALRLYEDVLSSGTPYKASMLEIRGGDLAALGFRGPMIGETMQKLLHAVMDGEIPNTQKALMEFAQKFLS